MTQHQELADALLARAAAPHLRGRAALVAAIHAQRTQDPTPDIDDAWKRSGVSKPQLADALWPLLVRLRLGPPSLWAPQVVPAAS